MFKKRSHVKTVFEIGICVENDGEGFHAFCPALKGLHVDGDTKEEALENARKAVILYLQSLIKHNEPIPIAPVQTVSSTGAQETLQTPTPACPPKCIENILVYV
ncbi:type II toxin-antitoxin system HicB family antitoxin [Candidatus Poribacteria bacterium]|nr:type II toxin-antitoxin system HicB family antitoxin [Candidatus Poribacteria bacterium]